MSCKIEHKKFKGVESPLGEKLLEIYKDLDKAKEVYDTIASEEFISKFGNWVTDNIPNRTNSTYEPLLITKESPNGSKTYYFQDAYGDKIDLEVREFSSFDSENLTNEINEITEQLASYIFKKHIKENFDNISEAGVINFSKEIKNFTDEKIQEYTTILEDVQNEEDREIIIDTIDYIGKIDRHNDEFVTEVINFFNSKKLILDEESDEDTFEQDNEVIQGSEIKASFERNTKDKATANVKLLVSFLPRYEFIEETGKFERKYGNVLGEELFVPSDAVHKELLKELSNIVTIGNEDIYQKMLDKIKDLARKKPHYNDLIELLNNVSEDKKTEFASAMFNSKINFYTTIKSGSKEFPQVKVFNSTEQRNKADKLLGEWFVNFKNIYKPKKTKKYNVDSLNKTKLSITKLLTALQKKRKNVDFTNMNDQMFEENFGDIISTFTELFKEIGIINLSTEGFSLFLNKLNTEDTSYLSTYNKIQSTLVNLQKMITSVVDSPRNIKLNPFKEYKSAIFKDLSESEVFYSDDVIDDTVRSGNKMRWTYGNPSYISNQVNKYKEKPNTLKDVTKQTYSNNSEFAKHLLGEDESLSGDYLYDESTRKRKSSERLDNFELGIFSSLEEEDKSSEADDNKTISYVDQLTDEMNKVMQGGITNSNGKSAGLSSIYSTIQAADKSTRHELKIDYFNRETISSISGKKMKFSNKTLNIFSNYYLDEINRMKEAVNELENLPKEDYKVYYHSDKNGNTINKNNVLVGNAFRSHIFPELSPIIENEEGEIVLNDKFLNSEFNTEHQLFDVLTGQPLFLDNKKFTNKQKQAVKTLINDILSNRIKENFSKLVKLDILSKKTEEGQFAGYNVRGLDRRIFNSYKPAEEQYLNGHETAYLVSDYTINSIIANVEYSKLFTGDPAYYKNMVDFFKRVPATYTDGLNLRLGLEEGDSRFTLAVLENQVVGSKYIDEISKSLDESGINKQEKKYILDSYKQVNQTDAQGWISPQRWKFIIERLGRWNDNYQTVYEKMLGENTEPLTTEQLKTVAQPLKGVYFGVVNGVPTYLKYSQAVLYPELVEGSQLENLYNNMINNGVDEAVTLDGVKVGGVIPNKITDSEGNILKDVNLNLVDLQNSEWKLQQDLPTKLIKDTLLGSQIQKNIYSSLNINDDTIYTLDNGEILTSSEMFNEINNVLSKLSDKGIENLSLELGKDESGRIDNEKFFSILEQEALDKQFSLNMLKSIQKGLPIDSIPGIKEKMYNMLFARIRKAAVKIKTNGGSFIQMSNFGLDKETADKKGVIWLVEPNELKPPTIIKDLDGKKRVRPGQIFISHSEIAKFIPNYKELAKQGKLKDKLDNRLLRAIGYRIPNQGMSSNDSLEIVGILPESMGDTIVGYTELPTKTGSDFDIDKMYVILPESRFRDGKLWYVEYLESEQPTVKQLRNKLFELYWGVLTNPVTYNDLITPIDFPHLKNHIKKLHGDNSKQTGENFKFYDPIYQLELKRKYISGKAGVGVTANMLVDYMRSKFIGLKFNGYNLGIGHTNENNETIFDEEYSETLNGTKYKIAHTISAFLNAFVDNAKDPFIDDGNYNLYTSNIAFMLIRAGVHPDWINAFMGQPVLKEIVEFMDSYESKAIPKEKEWLSALDIIHDNYIKEFNKLNDTKYETLYGKVDEFSYKKLEYFIKYPEKNSEYYESQIKIINIFKEFQDQGKKLSESVQLSRFDTLGAGKDYMDGLMFTNRVKEILAKGNKHKEIGNHIGKYIHNGKLTSLGTQVLNTLGYSNELMNSNPNLFLLASNDIKFIYNTISSLLINSYGGSRGLLKDKTIAKVLNDELYSYIMSDFPKFKIDQNPLEYIEQTIEDIIKFKNTEAELELEPEERNKFINEIEFFDNSFGIFSSNMSKDVKDSLYRSFRDVIENEPELADRIIISSYLQNGFKRTMIDIREFIPHEWFIANDIRGFFRQKGIEITNGKLNLETFRRQLMMSNTDLDILVPKVTKRTITAVKIGDKTINSDQAIRLNVSNKNTGYNRYVLGESVDKQDVFVDYLQTEDGRLYELQGYMNGPIYTRINKLGKKNNKAFLNNKEYKYNESSNSMYASNNTGEDTSSLIEKLQLNTDFVDKSLITLDQTIQKFYTKNLNDILKSPEIFVSLQNNIETKEDWTKKDNDTDCIF